MKFQRHRDRYRRDSRDRDYRDRSSSHPRGVKEEADFPSQADSRSRSPMDTTTTDHLKSQKEDGKDSTGKRRSSSSRDRGR